MTPLTRLLAAGYVVIASVALAIYTTSRPAYNAAGLGTLAEWFAAVGTVAAVSVALYEVAQARRERTAERAAQLMRDRRSQAERVVVWIEDASASYQIPPGEPRDIHPAMVPREFWTQELEVRFLNGSELPVFDLQVTLGDRRSDDQPGVRIGVGATTAVGPGAGEALSATYLPRRQAQEFPFAYVDFTDAAGKHWRRRSDGRLDETSTNVFGRRIDYVQWDEAGRPLADLPTGGTDS